MGNSKQKKILVIHGPNLHLLGKREPGIYGNFSLDELNNSLYNHINSKEFDIEIFQTNSEGEIVEKITKTCYDFLIINPAAYTHTSVAIRDALLGINKPTIEVHISNIFKREEFRQKSLISDVVIGVICGLGKQSYLLGLEAAVVHLRKQ